MATANAPAKLMTTEEFLALPDDGVERMLIQGVVYELGAEDGEMTKRSPTHSFVEANVVRIVGNWVAAQPIPRGRVYCGEVAFRIRRNPDSTVGIDVAYADADTAARTAKNSSLVEGPPVLAVEVLSPSDKQEDIWRKVQDYLDAGTQCVWVLDPVFETLVAHRLDAPPTLLNADQELSGAPYLPGLRCKVAEFFGA